MIDIPDQDDILVVQIVIVIFNKITSSLVQIDIKVPVTYIKIYLINLNVVEVKDCGTKEHLDI